MKKILFIFLILILLINTLCAKTLISISFDGTVVREVLDFYQQENIVGTFFLSAPYYITKCEIQNYNQSNFTYLPWRPNSKYSTNKIIDRIKLVDRAIRQGCEIGGHAVGHFRGEIWTYQQWIYELKFFANIMNTRLAAYHLNDLKFGMQYIKSFRAPELSVNQNMYLALRDCGYLYDSSQCHPYVSYIPNIIPVFPLTMIRYKNTRLVAMDFNFFKLQCNEIESTNQNECRYYEDTYYNTLVNHLTNNINKTFIIGNHGSMWNKGAYWKALQRFILFSKQYDVQYITFGDLYKMK